MAMDLGTRMDTLRFLLRDGIPSSSSASTRCSTPAASRSLRLHPGRPERTRSANGSSARYDGSFSGTGPIGHSANSHPQPPSRRSPTWPRTEFGEPPSWAGSSTSTTKQREPQANHTNPVFERHRLPADQLEQGVFGSLLETLSRTDLIEAAVANTYNELGIDRDQYTQELASVELELVKTQDAIDRYLTAFENGTMPEATCAPRIATLAEKAEQLTERRDELGLLLEQTPAPPQPAPGLQAALYAYALEAIHGGADGIAKQLMQALVHEVRVTGPRRVKPVFRIPTDGLTELADDKDAPEVRRRRVRLAP